MGLLAHRVLLSQDLVVAAQVGHSDPFLQEKSFVAVKWAAEQSPTKFVGRSDKENVRLSPA